MRIARSRSTRSLAVAVAAAGLLAGGVTAAATGVYTTERATDTVAVAAAEHSQKQSKIIGRFEVWDTCPYLVTPGGKHYYLPGYTVGGNGALYKKSTGGFIAHRGWKIQANGTKYYKSLDRRTTLCTTWGDQWRIKAKSIYALQH
ncbi:hypothetical protein OHS70_05030 [Streptomyces sp. NBC_00390]|uniref:hypothetical protein n=1 Tax=Streptomyces sp. NBC_00390 TaxID=2975736 RepID=UPI002E2471A0